MKKILFIAPSLRGDGIEFVLVKTINNLDNNKYIIKLVLINKEGELLEKIREDIDIIDLKSKRSIFSIFKIISTIKKEKPNFIFSIIGHINIIRGFLLAEKIQFIANGCLKIISLRCKF